MARRAGWLLLGLLLVLAAVASALAPHDPNTQFRDHLLAPPMRPHLQDDDGRWRRPFFYPLRVVDRLERRFEEDRAHPVALRFFTDGRLITADTETLGPWLPLGSDRLGRDMFSRLAYGARISFALAMLAVAGALSIGVIVGAVAGAAAGGWIDHALMRLSELVLIVPALYLLLVTRALLPMAVPPAAVFALTAFVLAAIGWPTVARGVRTIVATEAARDYAVAARAAGAGRWRLLWRHLLPATRGFVRAQAVMLLPAAMMAETTLSYAGLGFDAEHPSWGTLLQEAADIRAMADFPWLLSAAAALVLVMFSVNLVLQQDARASTDRP
jgi:peptide/nickel transport system permease protein